MAQRGRLIQGMGVVLQAFVKAGVGREKLPFRHCLGIGLFVKD